MKSVHKKQVFNGYLLAVILLVPILAFVGMGLDTGLLPKFWELTYSELPKSEENPIYFFFLRENFGMVGKMEFDAVLLLPKIIPLLAGLTVIPFIQMRDSYFQFAKTRMLHAARTECGMVGQTVGLSGAATFIGYLLTMLGARLMFVQTYVTGESWNAFVNDANIALDDAAHPYLYLLALGAMRFLLFPMLMALLTIAVSYLTKKIYIYLLVPTVYVLIGYSLFSQGMTDKWPLPLFSPENFIWPKGPQYWGFGHETGYVWGIVCASLIIIVPSLVIIWWGMRKRRA